MSRIVEVLMLRDRLPEYAAKEYLDTVIDEIFRGSDAEELLEHSLKLEPEFLPDLLELL